MKFNFLWVFVLAVLFASCQGGIVGNPYLDNQGDYLPVNDSVRSLEKAGYVHVDSSVAGNPLIQKVMVTVKPSFRQKYRISKANHTLTVFYVFSTLCILLIIGAIITGINPGKAKALPIILSFASIPAWLVAAASVDWAHEKENAMPLMKYDSLNKTPGALDAYWDENLLK